MVLGPDFTIGQICYDLSNDGSRNIITKVGESQIILCSPLIFRAYLAKKWKSLAVLIGPVLLCMWLSSSLIIYTIFSDKFSVLESMVLAACITPTDPVLASSVVTGKFAEEHIPEHVRDLLSAERLL